MRTTVQFDEDTAKAVDALRGETGKGLSEAVNELIRRGVMAQDPPRTFRQRTRRLGLSIDVSNVADALDVIDGPEHR
ncbi:MAG: ribbon-helix-helix protein, CopG family [Acidimicrobiia bacterium]